MYIRIAPHSKVENITEKNNHKSLHKLYSLSGAIAAYFGLINQSSGFYARKLAGLM